MNSFIQVIALKEWRCNMLLQNMNISIKSLSSNDPDYVPTTQDNNDEMINILIISSNKYQKNNKYFRYWLWLRFGLWLEYMWLWCKLLNIENFLTHCVKKLFENLTIFHFWFQLPKCQQRPQDWLFHQVEKYLTVIGSGGTGKSFVNIWGFPCIAMFLVPGPFCLKKSKKQKRFCAGVNICWKEKYIADRN